MPAREIIIDGVTLLVEVDEGDSPSAAGSSGLVERGAVADRVRDAGAELRSMLGALMRPVRQALDEAQPDSWGLELSIGFKGTAGVPCLTQGEANAAIKVTASWKKAA
ncbi:MAG TPA: CU044_2847 family protein [Ideonella sp.]|nr:CU044_2847 family protein [Ideonella sp.]